MKHEIKLDIQAQPDNESCGPTCLHALYRHYGVDDISLKQVISEIQKLDSGGTLIEILAVHALKRGFDATIYTYHLQTFDPTWFADDGYIHDPEDVIQRLRQQLQEKKGRHRLRTEVAACTEFLELGGRLKMEDLTPSLIRRYIAQGSPLITGLSSTFLYRESREMRGGVEDDVRGEPQGHFVMLVGYDTDAREVLVADPLDNNPPFHTAKYRLSMDRLLNALLLGILTHDANLLVITPRAADAPDPAVERALARAAKKAATKAEKKAEKKAVARKAEMKAETKAAASADRAEQARKKRATRVKKSTTGRKPRKDGA